MITTNDIADALLELSFGCYLLGYYDLARAYRAAGRKACQSSEELDIYDRVSGDFMQNPDDFMFATYKGKLDDLLDHARALVSEEL